MSYFFKDVLQEILAVCIPFHSGCTQTSPSPLCSSPALAPSPAHYPATSPAPSPGPAELPPVIEYKVRCMKEYAV